MEEYYEKECKKIICSDSVVSYGMWKHANSKCCINNEIWRIWGRIVLTNLTIQTDRNYVSASVSCSPESPSDVYSVRLLGNARNAQTGLYDVLQASGFYNNCYTQKPGEYVYASCAYYIEGSQVEFMELFA